MAASPDAKKKRLYLLDAMALAYRSHFIFINRPLVNSKGENTSAAYGFTTALLKLMKDHGMDHIAVVFDAAGPGGTFRDELYEEYKANRQPMPDDLKANLPFIKRIVRALDIPVFEEPGVEADDVIGTLARRAAAEEADVVIVSPDKDFQQLLDDRVSIFRPAYRGEEFDPITADSFREKFGVEPIRFIDILALMGDASDNVPGVPGIGEKTAMQLISQYGDLDELLARADEVKGKRAKEGLQNHRRDALMSRDLVTIRTDVPVDLEWDRLKRSRPDLGELAVIFRDLEFASLLDRFRQQDPLLSSGVESPAEGTPLQLDFGSDEPVGQLDEEKVRYRVLRNRDALVAWIGELEKAARFAFDTETTSVDPTLASLVGVSVSWEAEQGAYIPTPLPDGTSTEDVLDLLRPHLESERAAFAQNAKYDIIVLARHGVRVPGPVFDTMVAHYLIAPEEPHNLDALARTYLNYRAVPISELIGTGKNQISTRDVPIDRMGLYACEDADVTLRLAQLFRPELDKTVLSEVAERIEFPLIPVLADMEMVGIRVDPKMLKDISGSLGSQIDALEKEIYEAAGGRFNIGSTQQLGEILFDKLKLRVVSKTSTGKPSTRENVLEELSTEHRLPGLILDWRHLAKLKSTYVDALGDLIHPETGRIHTNFNQTVTATGRLSSSNPNLQNIPVRTDAGREIRKAFVAADGCRLLAADYVQIELRILASMSGDEAMKAAFFSGQDVHTATAARIYGVEPEAVTRDMRRKAKEVNYGIPYGVSAWGLAQRLRTSNKEAQDLIDEYARSYPGIARYLVHTVEEARRKGYAETLLGRRRYVPAIDSRSRNDRSFAERIAVNMPIQGTQADMIKIAMIRIHARLRTEKLAARMVLQVHDELVLEVPEAEIEAVRKLVEEEMVGALPLEVPVEVDINTGENWLDAH